MKTKMIVVELVLTASIYDLSAFLLTETKWRLKITHAENKEANIQSFLPNKLGQYKIYYMAKKRTFSCATKAGNPRAALPARVAKQNVGFASFCALADLGILQIFILTIRQ